MLFDLKFKDILPKKHLKYGNNMTVKKKNIGIKFFYNPCAVPVFTGLYSMTFRDISIAHKEKYFSHYVAWVLLSTGPSASDIYIFCKQIKTKKIVKPLGFEMRSADPSQISSLVL